MKTNFLLNTALTLEGVQKTPGKFDNFVFKGRCVLQKIDGVLEHLEQNYLDTDGTFADIKLIEFDKWLPLVRYTVNQSQIITEECFDSDATPEIQNEILRMILQFLGFELDKPALTLFTKLV
jgi:hypothetical protein